MRLLVVLAISSLSGFTPLAARELRSSDILTGEHPAVEAVGRMSEVLGRQTAGKLSIAVAKGDRETELYSVGRLQNGTQDMARVAVSSLSGLVPSTRVLSLPFLFRSQDHLRRVIDGPVGREILGDFEAHGLVGLCFLDVGPRSMLSIGKPIRSPADLKGVHIHVQAASFIAPALRSLGAIPVTLPPASVMPALDKGVVKAKTVDWSAVEAMPQIAPGTFMNLTEHARTPGVVIISKRTWDSLGSSEQTSLREACHSAQRELRNVADGRLANARALAEGNGITIIEDVDRLAFQEHITPLYGTLLGSEALLKTAKRIQEQ